MPDSSAETPTSKRFRIAFSFAGEKRDFVARVARILADRFGEDRILYDKFHEAEFARYDLGIRLPILYGEQSELIVPVLCPNYDAKRWTGWEWVHIYGLLTKTDGHRVMPSRFLYAVVDGISPAAAFIELDDKTPEQFAALILERLALNEGKPKDYYTKPVAGSGATPRTSIPHNLPSLQPFFGREEELRKIAEVLDPNSRSRLILINGPAGMGKTSLAVRAAYDAPAAAFNKIVFVSLKSRELDDGGVRDLSGFLISGINELLNELARELGHEHIVKAVDTERPRLLLDALRGTKTLLVLDNLESLLKSERDTVFTLVKKLPPGCKAILTSRGRIGSGAEELILEKLSEEAALATLAKFAETNSALARSSDAQRRELYNVTAGKPLLLRWTAGQIGRGSCLTIDDAIAYLRSCPKGNDPLEFIFGDLVDDFSAAETSALCALTYFILPAKVEHLAAINGRDEKDTELALKLLANRSLVVPSEELKIFTLVPLVADFLRAKKPEVLQEIGDRLEKLAYAQLLENGREYHDRFPVLEAGWPTVAASLPRFLAGENDRLQTVCESLEKFLEFTGRWDERLSLSHDAERRALAAGDFISAGWRAEKAGWIHFLRRQSSEVLACADHANAHWQQAKAGARQQAAAIRLRALGHCIVKDYPTAITAFREAIELLYTLNRESLDLAITLNDLAGAEGDSGDLEIAEVHLQEALRIARNVEFREGVDYMSGNLVELALIREDWRSAEALARSILPLAERIGRVEVIATECRRLAIALARQGKKKEALPYARRAVEIYQNLGSPDFVEAQNVLAECEG